MITLDRMTNNYNSDVWWALVFRKLAADYKRAYERYRYR